MMSSFFSRTHHRLLPFSSSLTKTPSLFSLRFASTSSVTLPKNPLDQQTATQQVTSPSTEEQIPQILQELTRKFSAIDDKLNRLSSPLVRRRRSARAISVDFSYLDCTDPENWIRKAERFFEYHQTPLHQRMPLASLHIREHEALIWYRCAEKCGATRSWDAFTRALLARFRPSESRESPAASIAKLRQESTVKEYEERFLSVADRVADWDENYIVGCFAGGLKEEIRRAVEMFKPASLSDAIKQARHQERIATGRERNEEATDKSDDEEEPGN